MKIICCKGDEVVLKSDNAVSDEGEAFYLPDEKEGGVEAYPGIAIRISRICKSLPLNLLPKYYEDVSLALDLRKPALKGAFASSFDYSFVLGGRKKKDMLPQGGTKLRFLSGEKVLAETEIGLLEDLFGKVKEISSSMTLKTGDVIFVSLTEEAFPLEAGMVLTAELNGERLLECPIK